MNKIEIIHKLQSLGYSLGSCTEEEFANAFSESMLMTIWNNFIAYKMGR